MDDKDWKEEYKKWKPLNPFEIELLNQGANSLSQSWLLNAMWCDWKNIKKLKDAELPKMNYLMRKLPKDPWEN